MTAVHAPRARHRPTAPVVAVAVAVAVAAGAAVVLLVGTSLSAAAQQTRGRYRPPVSAPIVERFRAPEHPYGPGNRGVDYRTAPGSQVLAASEGEVAFAGPVAGRLVVVVRHPDGLRTTYDGLDRLAVGPGTVVQGGQPVGMAGDRLHFGVRDGAHYLDPEALFAASAADPPRASAPGGVRLVPTDGRPARARSPT